MTREEAIKNLVAYAYYVDEPMPEEVAKSIDMAIEALSVDLVRCGECIYRDSCSELGEKIEADDYCSFGKRRSDD